MAAEPSQPDDQPIAAQSHAEIVYRQATSFSGPLPPPATLQKYNELIVNGAERILAMAEQQGSHRRAMEAQLVSAAIANQLRGSYFTFIISMTAILGGFILIEQGKSAVGLAAIITSLAGLAAVFLYGKHEQSVEKIAKDDALLKRKNR